MATIPTPGTPPAPMEPAAIPMEGAEPQAEGGFTVCIRSDANGNLSVGLEGGEYTPAETLKDALTKAMDIIQSDGQMPAPEDESAFDAGFASRSGGGY